MRHLPFALLPLLAVASFADPAAPAIEPSAPPAESSQQQGGYDAVEVLKAAYKICCSYNDLAAAAPLATQLAVFEPAESGKWLEELVKIHLANGNLESCLKVIEDLKKDHGGADKLPILEMEAHCHETLGHKEKAAAAWQIAWKKGASAVHAARLAGLQIELGKIDDADASVTLGFAAADFKTATLQLQNTKGEMQTMPVAAALHNLRALTILKRDSTAKDTARAHLDAALVFAPDFAVAKRNLASLSQIAPEAEPQKTSSEK
jgi:hypothetical protein